MTRRALALLALLALTSAALAAQPTLVRLPVGARVRVAAPPRVGWVTGNLATDAQRVVVRGGSDAVPDTIVLAAAQLVEVSRGRPRAARTVAGALIGGLIGGGLGALVATVVSGPRTEDTGLITAAGAVAGLGVGLVVGGAVGAVTAPERWTPVRLR